MRRFKLIEDARKRYPTEPSDKVMGVIFMNVGVRVATTFLLILGGRWIIFSEDASLAAKLFWAAFIVLAVTHIGYFLYTFHLYLQDNMHAVLERRAKEQAERDRVESAKAGHALSDPKPATKPKPTVKKPKQ